MNECIEKVLMEIDDFSKGNPDEKIKIEHKIAEILSKVKIAFRLNGNLGSILIRTNFVKKFVSLFDRKNVEITVYGHPKAEINKAIFCGLDFIDKVYQYGDLKNKIYKFYDLVVDVDTFPKVLFVNEEVITYKLPSCLPVLDAWNKFVAEHKLWFEHTADFRPQLYRLANLLGKNCVNNLDIGNQLNLNKEFIFSLITSLNKEDVFSKFGIQSKYITLNRGSYTLKGQNEGTRVWPLKHYNELTRLLKEKFPKYQLIQIGESPDCVRIDNIDLFLSGQTNLEELKVLLKNADLHVDGEGGMVHLRRAMTQKPSVVLFGSTPLEFFGHKGNINLTSGACPESCCELYSHWLHTCYKTGGTPYCLQMLMPEVVMENIKKYLENRIINDGLSGKFSFSVYPGTQKFISDKSFKVDERFVKDFVLPHEIYEYFFEEIKVSDLYCMYFTKKEKWKRVEISQSNCLTFLNGDRAAYDNYNNSKREIMHDYFHSAERFEHLVKTLNEVGYNNEYPIIVNGANTILDGQHRACWLLKKFGPDFKIKVVKIYGNFAIA